MSWNRDQFQDLDIAPLSGPRFHRLWLAENHERDPEIRIRGPETWVDVLKSGCYILGDVEY
jgi:hypothetical protein